MLRVRLAAPLLEVHRSEHIYVVPRTVGAQAGTAVIGATVEDVGFDVTTASADLAELRRMAAGMLPGLGLESAPQLEAWAGLRPGTPDDLPLLGKLPRKSRQFVASGHFRNGVLLAPATAEAMAQLLAGQAGAVGLEPFDPGRFLEPLDPGRFDVTPECPVPSIFAHRG